MKIFLLQKVIMKMKKKKPKLKTFRAVLIIYILLRKTDYIINTNVPKIKQMKKKFIN